MMSDSEFEANTIPPHEARDRDVRQASLERRLTDGYVRIDEAQLAGADVAQWESFWIKLLREYEDVCRELDVAA